MRPVLQFGVFPDVLLLDYYSAYAALATYVPVELLKVQSVSLVQPN